MSGSNELLVDLEMRPDPKPQSPCGGGEWSGCSVGKDNLHEMFPGLKVLPRPEPDTAIIDNHAVWEKEYEQWAYIRCPCGRGYFCREHGDWISGEEVALDSAVNANSQKNGSCPSYHYIDPSNRTSYVGRRDAFQTDA